MFFFFWWSNIKVGRILRLLNPLAPYKTKMTGSPGFMVTVVTSGQPEAVAERVEHRATLVKDQHGDQGELYPNARGGSCFCIITTDLRQRKEFRSTYLYERQVQM